jgi:hypothetical protein
VSLHYFFVFNYRVIIIYIIPCIIYILCKFPHTRKRNHYCHEVLEYKALIMAIGEMPWVPGAIVILFLSPVLILAISARRPNTQVSLSTDSTESAPLVDIADTRPAGRSGRFKEFLILFVGYFILLSSIISGYAIYPASPETLTIDSTMDDKCIPPAGLELLEAYGGHSSYYEIPIVVSSQMSKQLFDQGVLHLFGFNQVEAIRNFQSAAEMDPQCAMCYWGIAAAYGPNINDIVTESEYRNGLAAITTAKHLLLKRPPLSQHLESDRLHTLSFLDGSDASEGMSPSCDNTDLLFISSMTSRFPMLSNSSAWHGLLWLEHERSYAAALEKVLRSCAFNPDVATLRAEALLNLTPWSYFSVSSSSSSGSSSGDAADTDSNRIARKRERERETHRGHLGDLEELTPSALTSLLLLRKVIFQSPSPLYGQDGHTLLLTPEGEEPLSLVRRRGEHSDRRNGGTALASRINPLALHLYIHLTEQLLRPREGRTGAEEAADALYSLSMGKRPDPDSFPAETETGLGDSSANEEHSTCAIGHLLHMPAHMYLRLGRYADCIQAGRVAVRTDMAYVASCVQPYFASHNRALLVMCATNLMTGQAAALEYTTTTAASMDVVQSTKFMMSMVPLPQVCPP